MAFDQQPTDDSFIRLLELYDQTLTEGQADTIEQVYQPNPQLQTRLNRAQECLRLLKQIWSKSETVQLPPARFGKFQILRPLERCVNGPAFLAFDTIAGQRVVLKVQPIRTKPLYDNLVEQFEQLAQLRHDSILPVQEVGRIQNIAYLAMPYVNGGSLADWLEMRARPMAANLAIDVMLVLCGTLAFAHARGILHRKLKPSNILLRIADQSHSTRAIAPEFPYQPLLSDFELTSWSEMSKRTLAATSKVRLAVEQPPELLQTPAQPPTAALDVYGLGVILYELLSGRRLFQTKSLLELVKQILHQPPPSLQELGIPERLDQIVSICLRKLPEQRYPSVSALADDLRRVQAGRRPVGVPLNFWSKIARWWTQRERS